VSVLVAIRSLSKVYERGSQKVEALHNVDLDIERGDFLALMGPSGSGKTTLLNLIGGLDSPTQGIIAVAGRRIDQLNEESLAKWRASNVGFVFQFYNLLPMMSARKNVELPLLLTKLPASRRKYNADVALQLVGLADRTSRASFPEDSSSVLPSRGPSFRIQRCSCAMSQRETSTGSLPRKSWACCSNSIAITAKRSSWSHMTRGPPNTRDIRCISTREA
jgi:ABC-type glutathione transport system ATPase component